MVVQLLYGKARSLSIPIFQFISILFGDTYRILQQALPFILAEKLILLLFDKGFDTIKDDRAVMPNFQTILIIAVKLGLPYYLSRKREDIPGQVYVHYQPQTFEMRFLGVYQKTIVAYILYQSEAFFISQRFSYPVVSIE